MINKSLAKAFGSVLKELRDAQNFSQEQLALDSGLDRTYISMLERGVRQPTLTTLLLLANSLDSTMSAMIRLCEKKVSTHRLLTAAEPKSGPRR